MEYKVKFTSEVEFNVIVNADNKELAQAMAKSEVDKYISIDHTLREYQPTLNREIKFTQPLILTDTKVKCHGIIDEKHPCLDSKLVERFNTLWDSKKEAFKHILISFMTRDIKEMYCSNCFGDCSEIDLDIPTFRGYIENNWEIHADSYLNRVADDDDLRKITWFADCTDIE